jgi:hypothetical protein
MIGLQYLDYKIYIESAVVCFRHMHFCIGIMQDTQERSVLKFTYIKYGLNLVV